jgi:hypothetical protein
MSMRTLAAAALLALTSLPAAAQDRTTYSEGSRPRVLINWRSFEANGFPAAWKDPITNVVINAYTRLNLVLLDRARDQQRAESREPRGAAVGVLSGEDRPDRPEGEPLEGPKLRKGEALPADVLAKAAPKAIESAGGDAKLDGAPPPHIPPQTPERRGEIQLDRSWEFRPRPRPKEVRSHACLRGRYTHRYETTGREVFLCCIPVDVILKDSFQCAGGLPLLFGSPDDIKIRFCSLLHPTAPTRTYIRVCIPAPLQAPGLDACRSDAQRICPGMQNQDAIADCLKANSRRLSSACLRVIEAGSR